MSRGEIARFRYLRTAVAPFAAFLGLVSLASLPFAAFAQDTAIISRGDAAVTAFSGPKQFGEVPADLHPLDLTFIDTNGPVLQVFDLTRLGGPPTGQIADAPVKFTARAGEIGQVFGVTLDSDSANKTPNIYVTSTSLFGLQIVSQGGDRLVKGEPGARWMPGQFGLDKGGSPGSIWKIDGTTGSISLFANVENAGKDNAGPGLGDISYDSASQQLFVTDLETGLIHRFGLDGEDRGTFDHGTAGRPKAGLDAVADDPTKRMNIESPLFNLESPNSWGFADKRREVFAVAVEDGRLYYSVAEGPQIWSVGLTSDGDFADDARPEINVAGTPKGNLITDILFDGPKRLLLAQRGEIVGSYDYAVFAKPQQSVVLRYTWNEADHRWSEEADEFAIGLKPEHRATEGGIALNYGYDAKGNIDYGACDATLWTTGEHLREGEDAARVDAGGTRIVHGLQGTGKDKVRPDNVPPYATWFIDNDGQFGDAEVYGHLGDIAIFHPCDKKLGAEPTLPPYPAPIPVPVPPPTPGIYIEKACYPGVIGTTIHCTITVTNTGVTPLGPVSFWDAATILAGPGLGGGVIVNAVAPDGPDWICAPTPTPDLWCSLPPGALPPGTTRAVEIWIDTGPLIGTGGFGFQNCAALDAPWYGIACDEGGTDLTVTKTAPGACLPGGDCIFTVTITNTGSLPFSGDVLLTDGMFLPSGPPLGAVITAIVPGFGCAPASGAIGFSCVAPLSLVPGQSIGFAITVTMPAPAPAYWALNCFTISAAGLPAPTLPPAPGSIVPGSATSCAWVPVGAPPPLSNIRIEKTALHGGKCYKTGGGFIGCDYEIDIFNDGPSPFFGPVSFTDAIPPAATLAVFPAPWVCLGGPPVACGTPGPVGIPVGGSITVPVTVTIPLAPLEAAGCGLPNTATLTAPPAGTIANYFAPDDTSAAVADAFLEWLQPDGTTIVTCDPTNLKTTKVAKGDCVASGGGYHCDYAVTVTNLGPDPYHGPVKISEQLGFAPSSVTFSPPWGCTGGGASFQCTNPHVELEKGQSVELTVTAQVPDGPQCELTNWAAMTFPTAGTRFNGEAADDTASATAKIPSKSCVKPERPRCEPKTNEVVTESGACVCKSGTIRDDNGECVSIIEPLRCSDGKPVPKSGHCPETKTLCEPGPNETRNEQGQCVCKSGYEHDKTGLCVKPSNPADDCKDKGWIWNDKRKTCLPPPTPKEQCEKKGWIWDGEHCQPPAKPDEECKKKGWRWDGKRCLPPLTPEEECEAKGWRWTGERCLPPLSPAEECKKKGWNWDGKHCLPPLSPADECKKRGGVWTDGVCLSPADVCKAKGWNWDGKHCLPPLSPADQCKKRGGVWTDGVCLSPADVCKAKGWNWDGKHCRAPLSPADDCKKKGWIWDGERCMSPADACKAKGWNWSGKRCVPPAKTNTLPQLTPKTLRSPLQAICPAGTRWNDTYKKCMPPIE